MSNEHDISATLKDKLSMLEKYVDLPNELDSMLVGDNNLCPKHTQNNLMLSIGRTEHNEYDSFDFVDMLEINHANLAYA